MIICNLFSKLKWLWCSNTTPMLTNPPKRLDWCFLNKIWWTIKICPTQHESMAEHPQRPSCVEWHVQTCPMYSLIWCPQFFLQWISYRSYSGSIQILFFVPTIEFWIFLPYGMDSICWHLIWSDAISPRLIIFFFNFFNLSFHCHPS